MMTLKVLKIYLLLIIYFVFINSLNFLLKKILIIKKQKIVDSKLVEKYPSVDFFFVLLINLILIKINKKKFTFNQILHFKCIYLFVCLLICLFICLFITNLKAQISQKINKYKITK